MVCPGRRLHRWWLRMRRSRLTRRRRPKSHKRLSAAAVSLHQSRQGVFAYVKDYLLVCESCCDVTATLELSHRLTPAGRIRRTIGDIRGYRSSREEKDAYGGACPLGSINTTTISVETGTKRGCVGGGNLAALVPVYSRIAVSAGEAAGKSAVVCD